MFVPPPPHTLLTPHFYFSLELYVYITLTNNYLAFYHIPITYLVDNFNKLTRLLVNNHVSNYNSFILVLYRRYINYVSVCPPLFGIFLRHCTVIKKKLPYMLSVLHSAGDSQLHQISRTHAQETRSPVISTKPK